MANVPEGLYYSKDHEWLKLDGDTGTVGITDYAQDSLGDVVYVELPKPGETFVTKNGVTIIPAARIAGGAGGGGDQQEPQAGGVGFGVSARPVGAFVIKGGEVSWQPSLDLNRVILMGQLVGIVALLTVRAAIKAWAKRRT